MHPSSTDSPFTASAALGATPAAAATADHDPRRLEGFGRPAAAHGQRSPWRLLVAVVALLGLSGCAAATDTLAMPSTPARDAGAHLTEEAPATSSDVAAGLATTPEAGPTRSFRSAADDRPGARWDVERRLFLRAERALEANDLEAWRALRPFLDGYPLTPVLDAAALRRAVAGRGSPVGGSVHEVVAFAARHPDLPQTASLLREAIERRHAARDWDAVERLAGAFDAVAANGPTLGAASECRVREARLQRGDRAAAFEEMASLWLTGQSLPNACDPLLDAWRAAGGLTEPLALARLRLAAAAGEVRLARFLLRDLQGPMRATGEAWIELAERPARLASTTLRGRDDDTAAFLEARGRAWLRADLDAALDFIEGGGLARLELPRERVQALRAEAGVRLAVTQDRRAARYIDGLIAEVERDRDAGFGDNVFEWRVRAALRVGDWRAVLAAIGAMSEAARNGAQWAYWAGRALDALGESEAAREVWSRAAVSRDFHGILAAERLGQAPNLAHRPTPVIPEAEDAIARDPAISRMREYVALSRWNDARREWAAAIERWSVDERLAAARAFDAWGWHDRAIFTLARAQAWDDLERRFPLAFADEILAGARTHGVDPAWAFAIARQESAFLHDVRSSAGALGIMQIMPATAQTIARDAGVTLAGETSILDPRNNALMGTYYLARNAERFGGHLLLASAAYNAGHGRVSSWLPGGSRALTDGPVDADIWAELIPFAETRDYVRRVFSYKVIYAQRLGQPLPLLSELLAPVTAAGQLADSVRHHRAWLDG